MYLFGRLTGDIVKTDSWLQDDEKERVPYKKGTWLLLKPEMKNSRFTAVYDVVASVDITRTWIGKESISIHPWSDQLGPRYAANPFKDQEKNTDSNIGMDHIITFDDNVSLVDALDDIRDMLTMNMFDEDENEEEINPILQALYDAVDENSDDDDKEASKRFFKSVFDDISKET